MAGNVTNDPNNYVSLSARGAVDDASFASNQARNAMEDIQNSGAAIMNTIMGALKGILGMLGKGGKGGGGGKGGKGG
jgi:hypothetical protein